MSNKSTNRPTPGLAVSRWRPRLPSSETWRAVRFAALAVLLAAGGVSALHLSHVLHERADSMTRYVRVDVWAVQQAEFELQQFRALFARHVAGEADATGAVVRKHLAQAKSTIALLRRGPDYHEFRLLADIDGTADLAAAALDDIARRFGDRSDFRGDLAMLQKVEQGLAMPTGRLRQLAIDIAFIRLELQDGDLANVRWLAGVNHWIIIGSLLIAAIFIAFLLSEARAARRAETEARQARTHLAEAIESIGEGFALYDRDDRLVLSNRRFRQILLGAEEPPSEDLSFVEVIRACAALGRGPAAEGRVEEWLAEYQEYHRDPRGIFNLDLCHGTHLQISERAICDGGRVAVYADVTELRQREEKLREALREAEVANRSKTEFLANMSHELRTPLNAIIGFSEITKAEMFGPLDGQYKGYAGDINDSAQFLLEIINDILEISRIEAGEHELRASEFRLGDVVAASLRLVQGRAERAGHTLAAEVPDELPLLYADERVVKQILLNLLSNAIKFTPDGGRVTVRAGLAVNGGMEVQIADTGIGIAAEDIPKALSFFGQVDGTFGRRYQGTGLGLPLACRLAELHGGSLKLESEVDRGTTVTLRFPANRLIAREGELRPVQDLSLPVSAMKSASEMLPPVA